MFRIKHIISTIALVIARRPARTGRPGPRRRPLPACGLPKTTVVGFFDPAPKVEQPARRGGSTNAARQPRRQPTTAVTGRAIPTSSGIDWSLPVMGAIALGLIFMVAGDQLFFRRRGQLAT